MTATTAIRAIDTRYAGHLFRSRLEARWAVFFDALRLKWEYEPEGYVLPDGTYYLPDFRLTTPQGQTRWVEVKPSNVTTDAKFDLFSEAVIGGEPKLIDGVECFSVGEFSVLVSGSPLEWLNNGKGICPRCGVPGDEKSWSFNYCDPCDWETPSGGGHLAQSDGVMGTTWQPVDGCLALEEEEHQLFDRKLMAAAVSAQEARFEHGQAPQPPTKKP